MFHQMEFIHSFQDHIFISQLDKYFIYKLENNVWEYLLQVVVCTGNPRVLFALPVPLPA
jgi:hypothetical protein